jgi:CelD/BcsL family acetyltransferase involved in cellulose biosynthesis
VKLKDNFNLYFNGMGANRRLLECQRDTLVRAREMALFKVTNAGSATTTTEYFQSFVDKLLSSCDETAAPLTKPPLMNDLALRPHTAEIPPIADNHLVRTEIFEDLSGAEPHWRALEGGLSTPYQRYDFLSVWQRHAGSAAGVTPCIVVGFNAGGCPLFVWPFGRRRLGPWQVIEFLGGKHANFNMALWRCGIAGHIKTADLNAVLASLAGYADLVWLCDQPLTWDGTTNPFALLAHQRAANFGLSGALDKDFEVLLRARTNSNTRKKMRKKERALAELGTVVFEHAECPQRIRQVLDTFFKQKSVRMRTVGITNVFAKPCVRRFIEAAAAECPIGGAPPIELYTLSVDGIVVATMGGIVSGGRFCAMFNSIAFGHYAPQSPGEQLVLRLVRRCCERGLATFDLGIGEARYKSLFCGDVEPLFDSFLPLTAKGRLLGFALRLSAAAKRAVKQRRPLWALVGRLRRWRARLGC